MTYTGLHEMTLVPVADIKVGDIIEHVGLIAGTDVRTLVTGIVSGADANDSDVLLFETHWPLLASVPYTRQSRLAKVGHNDDDLVRALRMFETPPLVDQPGDREFDSHAEEEHDLALRVMRVLEAGGAEGVRYDAEEHLIVAYDPKSQHEFCVTVQMT